MSNTHKLAERIARLLEAEQQGGDLSSVFASIERINHRLDKLEAGSDPRPEAHSSGAGHPSQQKFAVLEAIADRVIEGIKTEKTCTFEPNGRPCDHCSMCSSRGF
jgi:hypothetical protein